MIQYSFTMSTTTDLTLLFSFTFPVLKQASTLTTALRTFSNFFFLNMQLVLEKLMSDKNLEKLGATSITNTLQFFT